MKLEHSFTVPAPLSEAWPVLLDIERVVPCLPGATLDGVDGETFRGSVTVKLGPITVTYRGTARFVTVDETARRVVIEAQGRRTDGTGTANATIVTDLYDDGGATRAEVVTALAVAGEPAQFGTDVMTDVGSRLLEQFAVCLGQQLSGTPVPAPVVDVAECPPAARPLGTLPKPEHALTQPRSTSDTMDLLDTGGGPVLTRTAGTLAIVAALVVLLVWWLSRWRQARGAAS